MSCCNHRRARLAAAAPRPAPTRIPSPAGGRAPTGPDTGGQAAAAPDTAIQPATEPPGSPAAGGAEVALRFTGRRRVRVEGVASGRVYRAGPAATLITARPEDVRGLLRSGLFARVPPG
jgi:hypothetical protein